MIALELAVETTLKEMILRALAAAEDATPVFTADEADPTEDFAAIIVEASRSEERPAIDEDDHLAGTILMEVRISLRSMIPEADPAAESGRMALVEEAVRSTDTAGLDLSRFSDFYVLPSSSSEREQDGDRQTKTLGFRVAVEEDRSGI